MPYELDAAARVGDLDRITLLLQHSVSVDEQGPEKRTTLLTAAMSGRIKVVVHLIKHGANMEDRYSMGRTALLCAEHAGQAQVVAELLRSGADIDAADNKGATALSWAVKLDHREVVAELVRHSAADPNSVFSGGGNMPAVPAGESRLDFQFVLRVLFKGVRARAKASSSTTRMLASGLNWQEIAAMLLRDTALDQESVYTGNVALLAAVAVGDLAAMKTLYATKILIEGRATQGKSHFFYAAECGQTEVARFLIENGALVHEKLYANEYHRAKGECEAPLSLAGFASHMQTFRELVEAGAPVNIYSVGVVSTTVHRPIALWGYSAPTATPLLAAARRDYFAGVRLLITHGGTLRHAEVAEDEYPLILGTLKEIKSECSKSEKFATMCDCL